MKWTEEHKRGMVATGKILYILGIVLIYWLAGRGPVYGIKIYRRWLIPILLYIGVEFFSKIQKQPFKWGYLWLILTYTGVLHIGYGAGSILRKVFGKVGQRAIVGGLRGIAPLPVAWVNKMWLLLGLQVALSIIMHIGLGAFNPIEAVEEEALLCLFDFIFILFMLKWPDGKKT